MKSIIKTYVQTCAVCQQVKPDRAKYPGLLQPLPVPKKAWQSVSLDFVEGLPKSGRFDCILVVVDQFSKYAHFLPLAHPFTAAQVATAYIDNIYKLHGFPKHMISDRDKIFTSVFWQELFRHAGTGLDMSSAQHPQTDGQTERVNQCLEAYLRCFVSNCPTKWKQWLPLVEYWYNTSYHTAIDKTPFEVLYGNPPDHIGIDGIEACATPDLQEWLEERQLMTQLLRHQLERAKQRMKSQADKKRSINCYLS